MSVTVADEAESTTVKASSRPDKKTGTFGRRRHRQCGTGTKGILPALVVLGGGCFFASASAVELGNVQVHSTLGQPLRASVAYALQPNEQIDEYCIYLRPGMSASGLPMLSNAAIGVSNGTIRLTGKTAIYEPLLTLQLTVDCPYTAHLRREYTLFIDPSLPSQLNAPAALQRSASEPARTQSRVAPVSAMRSIPRGRIAAASTYLVQPGDTLSGIAARLENRSVGIWQAADAIFAANAESFINNDRDRLRAGAKLAIPDAIVASQRGVVPVPARATAAPPSGSGTDRVSGTGDVNRPGYEPAATLAPDATTAAEQKVSMPETGTTGAESTPEQRRTAPRPGDVTVGTDSPFVSPVYAEDPYAAGQPFAAETEVIPATTLSPRNVPVVRGNSGATSGSWSRLAWLGGSGIALILGLLFFGRRLKERFGPASLSAESLGRRRTDPENEEAAGSYTDGSDTIARMITLGADIDVRSGYAEGEIEVAEEFGFSDPDRPRSHRYQSSSVAVEPQDLSRPTGSPQATILESEIPPGREDTGEYHVSMIVDATKGLTEGVDGTTKDLRAIELYKEGEDESTGQYTMSKDVDYKVLEQDYEDELTATQALNAEIARAARELSLLFNEHEQNGADASQAADDETSVLPTSEVERVAADDTVQMPVTAERRNVDDTDINEEIEGEIPAAENDATAEMELEPTTINRKVRAS